MKRFIKGNQYIDYEIIVKSNKHSYIRIRDNHVVVTTNKKMLPLADSFLNTQFEKLYAKIHTITKVSQKEMMLSGNSYQLNFKVGRFTYHKLIDEIYATGKDIESTKKQIYLIEIEKMMNIIHPKVIGRVRESGITPCKVKYKYLKSKFGSYHRNHDEITINTYLATLDPIYLEYVLYHEYAHKIVFNHSKDFYDILNTWLPGHKNIQKALKKMVIL